jgi:hypothetical protein
LRVYKLDLEKRIGEQLDVNSNIFSWLVEYAADMINKRMVGTDGKTAYERLKGKKHHGEFVRFCSRVMYRVQGKVQGGIMTERWFEGIWLMKRFHTEEHVVADLQSGKVVRARSIRKMPQEITAVDLRRVIGKPWAPSGNFDEGEDVKRGVLPAEEVLPERMDNAPRAVKITNQILEEFGFSENCPSCLAKVNGTTFTGPHTEACRTRIEDLMMSSENDLWRQKVLLSRKKRTDIWRRNWTGQSRS